MIKCIAAVDEKLGLGDGRNQPFHIKKDLDRFRELTWGHKILMGYTTYKIIGALKGRENIVASRDPSLKLPDAETITDIPKFLSESKDDVWVIGGGQIFAASLDHSDELYITQVTGDFRCTVFFPPFEDKFKLEDETKPEIEKGIEFKFQIWRKR